MNEFLTAVNNSINMKWGMAYFSSDHRYLFYMEAFKEMRAMFIKEMRMAVPRDDMFRTEQRRKRDIAVEEIMKRLDLRGKKDWHHIERFIAEKIMDAQF